MPGGGIMAACDFPPPPHHYHLPHHYLIILSLLDLTHIDSLATIKIGTHSRSSVLNRPLNNASGGHKKNAQLTRGLNTAMAAFKLVYEKSGLTCEYFWAQKAQVHADTAGCVSKNDRLLSTFTHYEGMLCSFVHKKTEPFYF